MEQIWRIEMLGTLRISREGVSISRFRTRRVAHLLAYLAYYRNRVHFRDEVGELLWPDTDPVAIKRNLRQALSSLRHVVEPPPLPPGSVLQVQQARLRLNPELITTDIGEFEKAIADARRADSASNQITLFQRAADLYRGEFLPGFHEEWITHERLRLDDLYVFALRQLVDLSKRVGRQDDAVQYLRLALDKERLNEDLHVALMRQYLDSDRPASAVRQYEALRQQLNEHFGEEPGETAKELFRRASKAIEKAASTSHVPSESIPRPPQKDRDKPTATHPAQSAGERTVERTVRLPLLLTRFCGREEELSFALDRILLPNVRLLTLFGPAGTGKTRLAVELGRRLAETGDWNLWFVPLADISTASMMIDTILEVVRARGAGSPDPWDRLRSTFEEGSNNLLILDNLEHIVDLAAPIIDEIVQRVPQVRLLVTSRQLLRLEAEHQVPVPPLPIPSLSAMSLPADHDELTVLATIPSVQIFVDRSQAIRPDFQLTIHNARAISTICAKLEGVPLAIELAAGLTGSFPPSQLVFHLQKRLTALSSRRRDMPARHRSLRAAIDYSYETLSPELQRFFAALSVFRGGFKIASAHDVCCERLDACAAEDVSVRRHAHDACLEQILELQERSLVHAEGKDDDLELKFRMLESFREYAEEHLTETDLRHFRHRHADYFRGQPAKSAYPLSLPERTKRHLWIESEYENYVAAIQFYFDDENYNGCIDVLETLTTTWMSRGPRGIERMFIRRLADRLDSHPIEPSRHILLLRMLGTTYIRSLEYAAAHRTCLRALAIAERSGLRDQVAVCYTAIATCAGYLGNLDECLELSRRVLDITPEENLLQRKRAYLGIGAVHWGRSEFVEAEEALLRAAEITEKIQDGEPDILILHNLARIRLDAGRFDEAMSLLGESRRICQRLHDDFGLATCLSLTSRYHWLRGNLAAAIATGYEALLKYREADFTHYSLVGLFQQALILVDIGEAESATTLLAATQGIGIAARRPDEQDHQRALQKLRMKMSTAEFERGWARGLAMDTEEAFRIALRYK